MADNSIGKVAAITEYMGVKAKPVTNKEMMALRKEDKAGFDWMAEACAKGLGKTLTLR